MNPYQILGISENATEEEIKKAYRELAKQNHPDLHSDKERTTYEDKMKEINEAYDLAMKNVKNKTSQRSSQSSSSNDSKTYSGSKNSQNNFNGNWNWEYFYNFRKKYEQRRHDEYQRYNNQQYSAGTFKLNANEAILFNRIMKNAKVAKDILDTISDYNKVLTNRSNRIIIRMRKALHEYYDRVECYMCYIDKINKLTSEDYKRILKFIECASEFDAKYANYLISSFEKVLEEETFPVLKFTNEYLSLMIEILKVKSNINSFGSTLMTLKFVENNLMGFASRSQLMYNANPLCKKYDNNDEYLNYLANCFYMMCLTETADYDVFAALSRKGAFDDFVREEANKNKKTPKLRLVKDL